MDGTALDGLMGVVRSTRDHILADNMQTHRGHARELAMAATKLDEALHWLTSYGLRVNSHLLISKEKYRSDLDMVRSLTDKTVETEPEEAPGV